MYYREDLRFFQRLMENMRIKSHVVDHHDTPVETFDFGLRKTLGREPDYDEAARHFLGFVEERTVYKMTDAYYCNYFFLILPETEGNLSLFVGPYITFEMSKERLMEEAESLGVQPSLFKHLEDFYLNIPIVTEESYVLVAVNTLAESLWGPGAAYKILDLQKDHALLDIPAMEQKSDEGSAMQIRLIEQHYAYENELLDKVSKGLWHRVELMLLPTAIAHTGPSVADPIRNQKHMCIICNTLLRKAAERGGVHPLHLDKISSHYARQIELVANAKGGHSLIMEMAQNYCRMVRQHNLKDYSPLIRKVITYIESELSTDLSLTKLAKLHNVSPEYLSSLFHKETQKTLTQYINEKRIELGASLLRSTNLQVQTIAENCGFPDAGYFSKLFKKRYAMTPKAYREIKEFAP